MNGWYILLITVVVVGGYGYYLYKKAQKNKDK